MKAQPTLATAIQIGNPVSINKAIRALQAFDGIVEQATESELADAAARADRTGMFNCPHTAVALAALEKLVARGRGQAPDRVIVISTANGLKFSEFKTGYHTSTLDGRRRRVMRTRRWSCPNDYDAVRRAIDRARRHVGSRSRGGVSVDRARSRQKRALEVWKFGGASLADVAGDREGGGADRAAPGPARHRRVGARRRHRSAARRRGGGDVAGRSADVGACRGGRSCAGIATSSGRCCPAGPARRTAAGDD